MVARRLSIRGKVQGVGYRYAIQQEATRLGIVGWVRNRADGTVEALVQGDARAVEMLIGWARSGPPAARVQEVTVSHAPPGTDTSSGFELRPTV
jgi:acylphosphatase